MAMHCFQIRIADLCVEVRSFYDYTYEVCRDYRTDSPWTDFAVYANRQQIEEKIRSFSVSLSPEMAECICLHEAIALHLWRYDAFVLHGCLFRFNDKANYAIIAPRGVGKTTHVDLWKKQYGNRVQVINGDKPILRRKEDGTFFAYGTPWCGKEGENVNRGVRLDAVCLLERGKINTVSVPDSQQYVDKLIKQVVFPPVELAMNRGAVLLADFIRKVPAVQAACNMNAQAAETVRKALACLSV